MSQEEPNTEFKDDRDDSKTIYGLPDQSKLKLNKSMIWVPLVIGMSVAAGIITTKGIQRLTKGVPKYRPNRYRSPDTDTPQTMAKATSAGSSSTSTSTVN